MAKILLTDKMIIDIKPPAIRTQISDIKSDNLSLVVQPSGAKSWVWRGRVRDKITKITLGSFQLHGLKTARTWADDLTRDRDLGIDIVQRLKAVKAEALAPTNTVQDVWNSYWLNVASKKKNGKNVEATVRNYILPTIASKAFQDVTRRELAGIVNARLATHPGTANKVHAYVSAIWRWATSSGIDISDCELNVYSGMPKPAKVRSRSRYLSDNEIIAVWNACELMSVRERVFYRLLLLTGARRNEIAHLERDKIDLRQKIITITSDAAKNGNELQMPLSDLAIVEIELMLAEPSNSRWLFPAISEEDADNPMSNFTRMHNRMMKCSNTSGWTKHDIRRTFTSKMSKLKVPKIVTESLLNHVSGERGGIFGVYDQFDYVEEQREAIDRYGRSIAALVENQSKT